MVHTVPKSQRGIAQIVQIERRITHYSRTTTEVTRGLDSIPVQAAPAPRLLQLIRPHRHIVNGLQWRPDVTLGENACHVRTGQTSQVLVVLNNTVLAQMNYLGVDSVVAQDSNIDACPAGALALVVAPLWL
jgi:hypothetical protein